MKKESMDDELKKNAPGLYEQRQQNDGFRVPMGYFESLEERILDQIIAEGIGYKAPLKIQKRKAKRFSMPQVFMAAAAAMALAIAAVWFFSPATPLAPSVATVELSEEEIESYLLENVQDFEADQLATLPEEELNEYQAPAQQKPAKTEDLLEDIAPEDVEKILNEMTEEELEDIL